MRVQQDRLDDLVAHRVHGAEGRHRLLRNQRDLAAADVAHLGAARRQAREVDDSPPSPSTRRNQIVPA